MRGIAIALGILASLIGVLSASSALSAVGGDPAYSARLWAGWASLALALLAGIAAVCMTARPRAASLTMLISGTLGFVCIYLYSIDTLYMVALRLWFLGTILAWISASTPASEHTRAES
jgi:peptidoglycan/LPS O-acetylase OafA/YrhL